MVQIAGSVVIVGPGAIGGLLAALLSRRGHTVICIGAPGEAPPRSLQVKSTVFGDFEVSPVFSASLHFDPDIIFFTVKSPALEKAARIVPRERVFKSVIISLLNGLGHAEFLRSRFGKRVAVGMIGAIEAERAEPGLIIHRSLITPEIELASDEDISRKRLEGIAELLRDAGIGASVRDREAEVIWRKLVRLNAISALTAREHMPLGAIRRNPDTRKILDGIVREGIAVAAREGVAIGFEETMHEIDALPEGLTTSLQRDIAAGRPSEIEAIQGGVISRARKFGIAVPLIEKTYAVIKTKIGERAL